MSTDNYANAFTAMKEAHKVNMEIFNYILSHIAEYTSNTSSFISEVNSSTNSAQVKIKDSYSAFTSFANAWDTIQNCMIQIPGLEKVSELLKSTCCDGLKNIADQYDNSMKDIETSIEESINKVHLAESYYEKSNSRYQSIARRVQELHDKIETDDSESLKAEFTSQKIDLNSARSEAEEHLRLLNEHIKQFSIRMENALSRYEETDSTRDQRLIALVRRIVPEIEAITKEQYAIADSLKEAIDSIKSREDHIEDTEKVYQIVESNLIIQPPTPSFDLTEFLPCQTTQPIADVQCIDESSQIDSQKNSHDSA